jgi:hypothetical protein
MRAFGHRVADIQAQAAGPLLSHLKDAASQSRTTSRPVPTAVEALPPVVGLNGPTIISRIGVMRALKRHVERVFDPSRKDTNWETENGAGSMRRRRY